MIVHRITWNNQFAVEIEKLLAFGDRSKEKIRGHLSESHWLKKNMGSLGDSGAEKQRS